VSSVALNRYTFQGDYPRPEAAGGLEVDRFHGHWVTLGERLVQEFGSSVALTLGGEASWHFDVKQTVTDSTGSLLNASNPYRIVAGYAILDARLGTRARLSLGGRVDSYTTFGTSVNPRVGIVVRPYERGNTKLTVGRAFRAPSAYELYYNDGGATQIANPHLQPETLLSAEIEHSHRFTPRVIGSVGVFANTVRGLIDTVNTGPDGRWIQFNSTPSPIVALGTEIGLRREWRSGWMVSAYYGYTQTRFLKDDRVATLFTLERDPNVRHVANSPRHAATFKGVAPFLIRGLNLGTRIALEDGRWDRYEQVGGPVQMKTQAAVFWDLVLSAEDARNRIRASVGVYNLFDWRNQYPLGSEYGAARTIASRGRTLLASLETRF
jgi:outer membrane receptor protein involved in Fe transport